MFFGLFVVLAVLVADVSVPTLPAKAELDKDTPSSVTASAAADTGKVAGSRPCALAAGALSSAEEGVNSLRKLFKKVVSLPT